MTPEISIVVPLYNEEDNVPILQQEIAAALAGRAYELILVDDGSTDATRDRIRCDERTRVIEFAQNLGQSAALYAGMKSARGATVGLLDGDLQNDPADLVRLLDERERSGMDLVCGYRTDRQDAWSKRVSAGIANAVRGWFVGDGVRDTGCTLKVLRRECVSALIPFQGMHRFIPALVKGAGFTLAEMPVSHRARRFGASKYGLANRLLRATGDMFGVRWFLARRFEHQKSGTTN
ncbi:glycosyl transferase family 2 [Verrucomicrobia bacterium SCGC AG-212-E04]|nr:glycosyl transferase family 2 [Verrucomicrobia bacterium SCGC AG-212-E04]